MGDSPTCTVKNVNLLCIKHLHGRQTDPHIHGFSLMTSLTAAVSRSSTEGEILLRLAFHDGFNRIKVPSQVEIQFPYQTWQHSNTVSMPSAFNVSKNKVCSSSRNVSKWMMSLGKRSSDRQGIEEASHSCLAGMIHCGCFHDGF